jgi:hypothetical protein
LNSRYFIAPALFLLLAIDNVLAQTNQPTVEIVVSQPSAREGDTMSAQVYIRDAVNMGSADVSIQVDEICLEIVDYKPGDFLPSTPEEGGFIGRDVGFREHDARMQMGITDRARVGNGEGLFYQVTLEVTCTSGIAALEVTAAELRFYRDVTAEQPEFDIYTTVDQSVTIVNAEVEIVDETPVPTPTPTFTRTPTPTITPTATRTPTPAPPTRTPVPVPEKPRDPIVSVFIAPIICIALFLLGAVILVVRRLGREGGI